MSDTRPIGVFDSGIGGLTLLREIRRRHPLESYLYFADRGEAPYGVRSQEFINQRSARIVEFLLERNAKLIVVACNSASVVALASLRRRFGNLVSFVGIEPAVKPAAKLSASRKIGLLATPATLHSDHLANLVQDFAVDTEVISQECPDLVRLIEHGVVDGPEMSDLLETYLTPMKQAGVDVVILGCTHFSLAAKAIQQVCGPSICLVDPTEAVARHVSHLLQNQGLINSTGPGRTTYYASGDLQELRSLLARLTRETDAVVEAGVLTSASLAPQPSGRHA